MPYQSKLSTDDLIQENAAILSELPDDVRYANLNYGLRTVMSYLVQYYDDIPNVAFACDHLAKLTAILES